MIENFSLRGTDNGFLLRLLDRVMREAEWRGGWNKVALLARDEHETEEALARAADARPRRSK